MTPTPITPGPEFPCSEPFLGRFTGARALAQKLLWVPAELPVFAMGPVAHPQQRKNFMDEDAATSRSDSLPTREKAEALGIVITDGGLGARTGLKTPVVRAFVYGEESPAPPTLPFGRWKEAS